MTIGPKNRSPFQTFGLAPNKVPKYGDPELLPKATVTRPSKERQPFGPSREAPGGVRAGDLKPGGPGPFPSDIFTATDIEGLPWVRKRGDEWTEAPFRALVMIWMASFFRARTAHRLVGWEIHERANVGGRNATRLPAKDHYLLFRIRRRIGEGDSSSVEVAMPFPPGDRDAPGARLALVEQSLDVQLPAIV